MTEFYTYFRRDQNNILFKGYDLETGAPIRDIRPGFKPRLWVKGQEPADYHSIKGEPLRTIEFPKMNDATDFVKRNESLGIEVWGTRSYENLYIYETFPKDIKFDRDVIKVITLDIETSAAGGFPDVNKADREITAITISHKGQTFTLGYHPYSKNSYDHLYYRAKDEKDLLRHFLDTWNSPRWSPDIVTGWNITGFDIPFLVNRITRELGMEEAKRMSPFKKVINKDIVFRNEGKVMKTYLLPGISILDYYGLYRKYSMGTRESYKLDFIAEYELGRKKVDYSQYGTLQNLYEQDPELYYDYNIQDCLLIDDIEAELHYIEQTINIAYIQKINFEDTLSTLKPWQIMIHHYLLDRNIVIPQKHGSGPDDKRPQIKGGYCKEPVPGVYEWVACVDFASLYPSLAMQFNISPETILRDKMKPPTLEDIISGDITKFMEPLINRGLGMAANGALFQNKEEGFIPAIMKFFFEGRKVHKKKFLELEDQYNKNPTPTLLAEKHKYDNLQNAFKLIGNSGYGAMASEYFLFFNNDMAEGITLSGQLYAMWVNHIVNKWMNEYLETDNKDYVIYQDTDSAYISLEEVLKRTNLMEAGDDLKTQYLVDFMKANIVPLINESCKELASKLNSYECHTAVKLEKVCKKAIWKMKKRYILKYLFNEGNYLEKAKISIIGLEPVKATVPAICRSALRDCIDIMMGGTEQELIDYVYGFKEKFLKFPLDQIGAAITARGLETYDNTLGQKKHTPYHVRGAIAYNDLLRKKHLENTYHEIFNFDKIRTYSLHLPNPAKSNVISVSENLPKELDLDKYIDYDKQFEKTFLRPIQKLVEVMGWRCEQFSSLDDVFAKMEEENE